MYPFADQSGGDYREAHAVYVSLERKRMRDYCVRL